MSDRAHDPRDYYLPREEMFERGRPIHQWANVEDYDPKTHGRQGNITPSFRRVLGVWAAATAVFALYSYKPHSDDSSPVRNPDNTVQVTAPHSSTPQTTKEAHPAQRPVIEKFADGSNVECFENDRITVHSQTDTLFNRSTANISPGSILFSYVYGINLAYNAEYNHLTEKDYTTMQEGDHFSLLSKCVYTSRILDTVNSAGNHEEYYYQTYQATTASPEHTRYFPVTVDQNELV